MRRPDRGEAQLSLLVPTQALPTGRQGAKAALFLSLDCLPITHTGVWNPPLLIRLTSQNSLEEKPWRAPPSGSAASVLSRDTAVAMVIISPDWIVHK